MERILTRGKGFIDEYGRERIFNGINIVDKGVRENGVRKYAYTWEKDRIPRLKALGINLIRLGFTWDIIEPLPGQYNEEYIAFLGRVLDELHKHGIYAFLDLHQDLYSGSKGGVGDGAPAWATLTDGYKFKEERFVWAEAYFWGKAVHRSFDNFWKNTKVEKKGLQDYYADMVQHLTKCLGDKPALIAFDFLNEPFPGSDSNKVIKKLLGGAVKVAFTSKNINRIKFLGDLIIKNRRKNLLDNINAKVFGELVLGAAPVLNKFDNEKYTPFLNKMGAAVREVDDKLILFVDNSYYCNLGIPCLAGPITVNGKKDELQCFGPHGYDFGVDTPLYKYASNERIKFIFDEHKRTQDRLDIPVIVGEWGGSSEGNEWFFHAKFILDMFDSHKWSHTYWCYSNELPDSEFAQKVLKRAYPIAVTGEIISYSQDWDNNSFTIEFMQDKEFDVPTEIFVPAEIKSTDLPENAEFEVENTENYTILKLKTKPGTNVVKISW